MSTHNICFYGEISKIIFQLSSNTLLICFSVCIAWSSSKCLMLLFYDGGDKLSRVMRKPVLAICIQQRCRSARTSAQSDQHSEDRFSHDESQLIIFLMSLLVFCLLSLPDGETNSSVVSGHCHYFVCMSLWMYLVVLHLIVIVRYVVCLAVTREM